MFKFVLRFWKMNFMNLARQMRKYLVAVLLPALVCLIINSSTNRHYHKLINGVIIYHAHPYDKQHDKNSPEKSHHHTNLEFFILGLIANSVFLFSIGLIFSPCRIHFKNINTFSNWIIPGKDFYPLFRKRAPPPHYSLFKIP